MRDVDVAVVGGGPAGSSCAAELVRAGANVVVLDRARFPRLKLCAGWITPEVVESLGMDVAAYPHRFNTFEHVVAHVKGLRFRLATPQHSIRRTEFDAWLLERSGAEVVTHNVRSVRRDGRAYVIDDAWRCAHVVGAGGTRCPVYRELFREVNPRARGRQVATWEHEFAYDWRDPHCHLWFFDKGLPGYSWYVPKADGYLNVGVGGIADRLKARGDDIKMHWGHFMSVLERRGLIERGLELRPKGYSYYVRDDVGVVQRDGAFIAGDAVGLATRDLCEGIGPAVASGQLAARAILDGAAYSLERIAAFSADHALVRRLLEFMFNRRRPSRRPRGGPGPLSEAA
jgi:flavin-dependent dehydrogenase